MSFNVIVTRPIVKLKDKNVFVIFVLPLIFIWIFKFKNELQVVIFNVICCTNNMKYIYLYISF